MINDDRRYDRYSPEIELKVMQLKHVIESIENYLCYIYNSKQDTEQFTSMVGALVTQTFAYFLGNEDQKEALNTIFQLIAKKVASAIRPGKAAYFARSLYGIDISNQVLNWADENIENIEDRSNEELFNIIVNLFMQLFSDSAKVDINILKAVLQQWTTGLPYVDIYNNLQKALSISRIEKLCSNTLSYHFCFLIGNILDAIGERSEKLIEQLTFLQKMIKYGVPSRFQILVCENIFDDRIIAKHLEMQIGREFSTDREFKKYMVIKRKEIFQILESYPDYFGYKFRIYIK